jgi:hypothetical protein
MMNRKGASPNCSTVKSGIAAALVCVLLLPAVTGCVMKQARSGGLRPSYSPVQDKSYRVIGEASGESSSFHLLWFVPVTPPISFDSAARKAIGSKGGDNLIDVRWWSERHHWLVGTVTSFM